MTDDRLEFIARVLERMIAKSRERLTRQIEAEQWSEAAVSDAYVAGLEQALTLISQSHGAPTVRDAL